MKNKLIAICFLICGSVEAQTVTFKPVSPLQTGWSAKGHTFKTGYMEYLSGPNGLYAQSNLIAASSFILETTVMWPTTVSNGLLAVKGGGFALKIQNGKLLHSWIRCVGDAYNMSELEVAGKTTLRPNTRYTIRYEYDAPTGQVIIKLNGIIELQYYRIWQPSNINWTTDVIQLFTGMTNFRLYSALISGNKPTLPSALTLRTVVANGIVHIERPDPTAINTPTRITVEDSYGGTVSLDEFNLTGATKRTYTLPEGNGINTVTITNAKGFARTVCVPKGPTVIWPDTAKGFYNVRIPDFQAIKLTGANMSCSDWVQQTEPDGSRSVFRYLDSAAKYKLKLSVVANYVNRRLMVLDAPTTAVHSYLSGDEVFGQFERFTASYNAIRVEKDAPVAMSLNNFTLIQKGAEGGDFFLLNIYNATPTKVFDIVTIGKVYRPVIAVLASYKQEPSNPQQIEDQIAAAKRAGAYGVIIFEYDHRPKPNQAGWYLPIDNPPVLETMKRIWTR